MSLITFRDKNSSGEPVGPTWYLQFDALTVEEFQRSAEVTQYPVETGAVLSDHYQPLPREISLQGIVSDTPSGQWTNLEGMQNAAAPPTMVERPLRLQIPPDQARTGGAGIARPISTGVLPSRRLIRSNIDRARLYTPKFAQTLQVAGSDVPSSGVNRIARFAEMLDGLMESRTAVNVILQTGAEFANMMITEHRAPRTSQSGGAVAFSVDMVEVVLADPAATTKAAQQRENTQHKSKRHRGKKNPKPTQPGSKELARFMRDVAPQIAAGPQ